MNRNEMVRSILKRMGAHAATAEPDDYPRIEEQIWMLAAVMSGNPNWQWPAEAVSLWEVNQSLQASLRHGGR